jgi:hypothetical protein
MRSGSDRRGGSSGAASTRRGPRDRRQWAPDHTTIARLRQRHERVGRQVLGLCAEAGLVGIEVLAIDGTKSHGMPPSTPTSTTSRSPGRSCRRPPRSTPPRTSSSASTAATSCRRSSPRRRVGVTRCARPAPPRRSCCPHSRGSRSAGVAGPRDRRGRRLTPRSRGLVEVKTLMQVLWRIHGRREARPCDVAISSAELRWPAQAASC